MSMTLDNLRVDHRVTVLRDFTDAAGITMRAGESGVVRRLSWDQLRMEIHMVIERASWKVELVFPLTAESWPRNGHMREYFEVGEDASAPRVIPAFHNQAERKMIVPAPEKKSAPPDDSAWKRAAQSTEGPDRLEAMETEVRVRAASNRLSHGGSQARRGIPSRSASGGGGGASARCAQR